MHKLLRHAHPAGGVFGGDLDKFPVVGLLAGIEDSVEQSRVLTVQLPGVDEGAVKDLDDPRVFGSSVLHVLVQEQRQDAVEHGVITAV